MGISGLLPLLKSIHKPTHLRKFAGQTLGVDAYGWLHRGTRACAIELAEGKPTDKYVESAMNRVRMLIHFGIKPYLVFDGDYLPNKAGTEKERAARRKEARQTGLELLKAGRTSQALLELQKAVDVTPEMARRLIEELKKAGVQYVVAPYEADSQMAYLERKGIIDGIISEDSDLLVFGARILLTKLDQYGECVMIRRDDFTTCREISMVGWSDEEFRRMAILSGCDYMNNIAGMGLKTAHRLLRRHKTVDRLVKTLQFDGKHKVPAGYLDEFENAERTFLHPWVFCPVEKRLLHLTPVPSGLEPQTMPYIGAYVEAEIALGVARGNLHPHTKKPIVVPHTGRTPARAPLGAKSKENVLQTPDLKKSKSIESFFKPARTPLAELDPNCFTPSPSQQQLLEQSGNRGSWTAMPAPASQPRPYLHQRSNRSSLPTPLSQPSRRTVSAPVAAHGSSVHPAKRIRLCGDGVRPVSDANPPSPEERSKFFAPAKRSKSSPEKRSPLSARKRTGKEFNIFSDDSIEDAMAELAAPVVTPKDTPLSSPRRARKSLFQVYEEGTRTLGSSTKPAVTSESQSTMASVASTENSQTCKEVFTQATSVEPESYTQDDDLAEDALQPDNGISEAAAALKERFTYSNQISHSSSSKSSLTPASLANAASGRLTSPRLRATPGEQRASTTASTFEEPEIADSLWRETESASFVVSRSPTIVTAKTRQLNRTGANSRIISKAEAAIISTRALLQQGSEDLLVPNSEDEASSPCNGSGEEDWTCVPLSPEPVVAGSLNLGRFAFAG